MTGQGETETRRQGEKDHPVALSPGHLVTVSPGLRVALPYLALLAGVLAMGMSAIFVKWANAPGPVNGFYRMVIAIAIFALPVSRQIKRDAPFSPRHLWLAALGGLFFALDLAFWNTSILITSAANATLLGNTSVMWVSLGAVVLFKERLRPAFWGGLLLALFGIAIIFGQDYLIHPTLSWGDLLAIIAGFFYGMFFLAAERARDKLSSFVAWWVSSAVSALTLLAVSLALGMSLTGYPMTMWLNVIGLALVTQVLGLLSVNYALGHLPASIVSPSLLGQPLVTAIIAVPLLGQSLGAVQIVGGLLALVGILIVHRSKG